MCVQVFFTVTYYYIVETPSIFSEIMISLDTSVRQK